MTRYFPERGRGVTEQFPRRCVIDGEIVVPGTGRPPAGLRGAAAADPPGGQPGQPARRADTGRTSSPSTCWPWATTTSRVQPFAERRAALERGPGRRGRAGPPDPGDHRPRAGRAVVPAVRGGRAGRHHRQAAGRARTSRTSGSCSRSSTSGPPTAWSPGYRTHKSGAGGDRLAAARPVHATTGDLASVGVIGAFPMARRRELFTELQPLVTTFDGHPWNWARQEARDAAPRARPEHSRWNAGKDLSFIPLRPERVVEVRYDHMEGPRFRHTAQFVRWRPDRDPRSCTYEPAGGAGELRPGGDPGASPARRAARYRQSRSAASASTCGQPRADGHWRAPGPCGGPAPATIRLGPGPGQERADGQAQLVQQARRDDLASRYGPPSVRMHR